MFRSLFPRRSSSPAASFDGVESLEHRLALSTVHWTGAGDGVTLNSRSNWENNHLPGSCDTAIVDIAANPDIRMSSGCFNPFKFILNEHLTVTGGTISVGSGGTTLSARIDMDGGVFTGPGSLHDAGVLHWTAGQITGSGNIDVTPTGILDFAGASTLELRRNVDSRGRINWLGGDINTRAASNPCPGGSGSISIVNEPGAFFKATGNGILRAVSGSAVVNNKGLFCRDSDGHSEFLVPVMNSGTLNVAGGTLELWAGGENTGQRNVAQDATLHYFGNFTHGAGSTLAGGGRTIWQGGTHDITADWTMDSYLYISNATVTGAGNWTIDGVLGWSHGTLQGPGSTTVGETGKIEIRTFGPHTLARDIVNNGTLVWNRGPLTMAGATITNPAGKSFYVAADTTAVNGAGVNRIVNHGEIRKVLPTAAGFGGITLDSDGLVNVHNGSLTLDQGAVAQLPGTTLAGGSWSVYGNAALSFSGAMIQTVGAGALVERIGPNAGFDALSALTRNEGTVRVYGGGAFDVAPVGGTFVNAGTLFLNNMTVFRVDGDFQQEASGTLNIGLAAPITLSAGRVLVAQNALLGGTVAITLELAYTPSPGDEFFILGATSAQGHFDGVFIESVLTTEFVYLPDGVILRFV